MHDISQQTFDGRFKRYFFSYRNPSAGSLVLSETGSLDRAKAAMERRKKVSTKPMEQECAPSGRVEETRVNPDDLIAELINNTDLEPTDDSLESKFMINCSPFHARIV